MRKLPMVLLMLLAGCAQAPGGGSLAGKPAPADGAGMAPGEAARIVAGLPAELAGLRRVGTAVDYEAQGVAGLGASQRYEHPTNGSVVTVFVYDRGRRQAQDGVADPAALMEHGTAASEMSQLRRAGVYRSLRHIATLLPDDVRGPGTGCAVLDAVAANGVASGEAICVAIVQGRFIKVRVTLRDPPQAVEAGKMGITVHNAAREALFPAGTVRTESAGVGHLATLF